jgi:hypothetical protein
MRPMAPALRMVLLYLAVVLPFAVAASKISDDAYRSVRELMSYKNHEISYLNSFDQYLEDCANASEQQGTAKKCFENPLSIPS